MITKFARLEFKLFTKPSNSDFLRAHQNCFYSPNITTGSNDMFLIAGVQPKTKTLDKNARICPACGLKTARNQRIDHYFSLFFIPLLRVKKGAPILTCDRCRQALNTSSALRCRHCNNTMDPEFKFCPFCGEPTH